MSDRLTDDELSKLTRIMGVTLQDRVTMTRSVVAELRERRALDAQHMATVDELVARRQADLSADDIELLQEVRDFIDEQIHGGADTCGQHRLQLAVLDRLLGHKR